MCQLTTIIIKIKIVKRNKNQKKNTEKRALRSIFWFLMYTYTHSYFIAMSSNSFWLFVLCRVSIFKKMHYICTYISRARKVLTGTQMVIHHHYFICTVYCFIYSSFIIYIEMIPISIVHTYYTSIILIQYTFTRMAYRIWSN